MIWMLSQQHLFRIKATEIKFLCSLAGYTISGKMLKQEIRRWLDVESITDKIVKYSKQWHEYVI